MERKLIFFDIDGTLMTETEDRIIPDSTKRAIIAAQENGHLTFINTGRTLSELEDFLFDLGFDGFVCGCGTYIQYHGEILLSQGFSKDLQRALIADLRACKLEGLLEGKEHVYYENVPYITRMRFIREMHQVLGDTVINSWDGDDMEFDKLCFCTREDSDFLTFYNKYKDILDFIDRGDTFYEIVPAGFSKASGMQFLEEHLGIKHENTVAFGDSTNDLSMLNYAALSIGMGNSDEEVKPVVDYITGNVEDTGIWDAMKHFAII